MVDWTGFWLGGLIGYIVGCKISNMLHRMRQRGELEDEWIEVEPEKHYRRRRYS